MSKNGDLSKSDKATAVVGPAFSAYKTVTGLRAARRENDTLVLLNALGSALVAVTGVLLAVRLLRGGEPGKGGRR